MDTTRFEGVLRRRSEDGVHAYDTREIVRSDGAGQFEYELLDVLELPPGVDSLAFPITYESAASFHWHFRRFRVRGSDRVLLNYAVVETEGAATVAGVLCDRLRIEHRTGHGSLPDSRPGVYEVDFEPQSGFVLAWRELDSTGHAFRFAEFEQFDDDPDLSGALLRRRLFPTSALDLDVALETQVAFPVRKPDILPEGYELIRVESIDVPDSILGTAGVSELPTGAWLRFLATDGIEVVSFMHSASSASASQGQLSGVGASGPSSEITAVTTGSWDVYFGGYGGVAFVASGRVSEDEVLLLVQSAF